MQAAIASKNQKSASKAGRLLKNWFEIFSAADREMIHSAMLQVLLEKPFFQARLCPNLAFPEELNFQREMLLPGTRLRCDLAALDADGPFLVVENKFKSFPTPEQLSEYDKYLESGVEKVLVVFDRAALGNCAAGESRWHVLTYEHIRNAIEDYLRNMQELEPRERLLLEEYVEYLDMYLKKYNSVIGNPRLLDDMKNSPDYRLLRRLFLGKISTRLKEKIPDIIIEGDSGGATEPLLDIYPPDWNVVPYKGAGRGSWPRIFMQLQGDRIKFYLRWREAGTKKTRAISPGLVEHMLSYLGRLKNPVAIEIKRIESRIASQNSSCAIFARPFTLTDNIEDSIAQVLDVYREIDSLIKKAGKLTEWKDNGTAHQDKKL